MDKHKKRKDFILDAAITQFLKSHDINIRDIAKETNEHIPTIYKFFGSKEGLISKVVEAIYREIANSLHKNLDRYDVPFLKVTQLGVNYINMATKNYELLQMILNYTNEALNVNQYSLLLEECIGTLKSLLKQLYETDRSIFEYNADATEEDHNFNVNILSSIAWASVDGLASICANKERVLVTYENFDQVIIETFIHINILSPKFREENQEIHHQALEIISTIGIS